jgi:hypothetical protein
MTFPLSRDNEPFMPRQHTYEEVANYDDGFKVGFKGHANDDTKREAWQRGWGTGVTNFDVRHIRAPCPIATELLVHSAKSAGLRCRDCLMSMQKANPQTIIRMDPDKVAKTISCAMSFLRN